MGVSDFIQARRRGFSALALTAVVVLAGAGLLFSANPAGTAAQWDGGWFLCNGKAATIINLGGGTTYGTAADDVIYTSDATSESIYAYGGDDTICSFGGRDSIQGMDGNDWVDAGAGDDWVHGGADTDTILGGDGVDYLYGEGGTDHIYGGLATDFIYGDYCSTSDGFDPDDDCFVRGDEDTDYIRGEAGSDWIFGGPDDDALYGDYGTTQSGCVDDPESGYGCTDWIQGDEGNDTLFAEDGQGPFSYSYLWGGAGDDWLIGGPHVDYMDGQAGRDNLYGSGGSDWLVEYGSPGTNWLHCDSGYDYYWAADQYLYDCEDADWPGDGPGND